MSQIEKTISNLIESQWPSVFIEEGPQLVAFVKAYYEWMETIEGPLYHSRRLLDYRDLDTTVNSFLIHFKNKYMSGIQLDTAVDTRQVVKHALDMYRSKGTERSIDLFFRNLFGVSAEIYYPGDDIFRSSDGIWVVPRYLEVDESDNLDNFIGLQVEGLESGATAFIEKLIVKRHKGTSRYANLYYINRPVGKFLRGEKIKASKSGAIGPVVLGSMNELSVISSSSGYRIGDVVDISSFRDGIDGKARVSSVLTTSGEISFRLDGGGWGYRSNSQVIISEKVLTVNAASYSNSNFILFETLVQPKSTVTFLGTAPTEGDVVFRIDSSNGLVYSVGTVLNVDASANQATVSITYGQTDSDADLVDELDVPLYFESGLPWSLDGTTIGATKLQVSSGSVTDELLEDLTFEDGATFNVEDITATANVVTWVDSTASANLMGYSANVNLSVAANTILRFANGDFVYQLNGSTEVANGFVLRASEGLGGETAMRVIDSQGYFTIGLPILSRSTAAVGTITDVSASIGVYQISGDFSAEAGNFVYGVDSGATATISRVSRGSGAEFVLANTFQYVESVSINIDGIIDYIAVELDAPDYNMPAPGIENQNTVLINALSYSTANVGKITSIIVKNRGTDYDTAPYVLVYDGLIANENKKDVILSISGATGDFMIGEPIRQSGIEKGVVKSGSNSTFLFLERISLTDFVTNSTITGVASGFTANVTSVDADSDTTPVGMNARIIANTASGEGVVSGLEIIDSGYNYRDFETVTFSKDGLDPGTAEARLLNQGFSEGFYKENRSVLSSDKYLQDGEYYQEYSYEIRSSIALEKYEDILRRIVHMAGTKHFSRYQLKSVNDMSPSVTSQIDTEVLV